MHKFFIKLIPVKKFREGLTEKKCRAAQILKLHNQAADFLRTNYIIPYLNGQLKTFEIKPKVDLGNNKIIWQYWGQGIDEKTPEIVKVCLKSVEKFKNDYTVIFLTDENISQYIDLPDFVYDKLKNNKEFTYTFFSDLLRIALLNAYGGIWLDATIFLTGNIPEKYLEKDFFVFQRTSKPLNANRWENHSMEYFYWDKNYRVNMLSSFMIARKDYPLIHAIQNILLNYWENENSLKHYFLLQILFDEMMAIGQFKKYNCKKISDLIPHYMHLELYKQYTTHLWKKLTRRSSIHKLTYWLEKTPSGSVLEYILNSCM